MPILFNVAVVQIVDCKIVSFQSPKQEAEEQKPYSFEEQAWKSKTKRKAHFALPIFFLSFLIKIPSLEREDFASCSLSVSILCKTLRCHLQSLSHKLNGS